MTSLIPFVWSSLNYEEQVASEKYKMQLCLTRDSNQEPLASQVGVLEHSPATLTDNVRLLLGICHVVLP